MNSLDAAYLVLKDCGSPLHYREITQLILKTGEWPSSGKTPEATVSANLAMDIIEKGPASRFQRTGKGTFALREWGLPEFLVQSKSPKPPVKEISLDPPPIAPPDPPVPLAEPLYSFTDAAELVLEKYSNKNPMHYREITDKIIALSLVKTEGKTPEATLFAMILTEINRHQKRGQSPRFIKYGKGFVGLRKWLGEGLAFQIQSHNTDVSRRLHARLYSMDPAEFEALIAQLLVALGFEDVILTTYSNDGGIDVRAVLVVGDVIRTRMAIQVKRWKRNVQAPVVQQVRGSLGTHEQGLIITTSDFSSGAREEAERPNATPVALMNGKQLTSLLIENDIGVHRTSYDLIELGEDGE